LYNTSCTKREILSIEKRGLTTTFLLLKFYCYLIASGRIGVSPDFSFVDPITIKIPGINPLNVTSTMIDNTNCAVGALPLITTDAIPHPKHTISKTKVITKIVLTVAS
jgi:hypothetical protein